MAEVLSKKKTPAKKSTSKAKSKSKYSKKQYLSWFEIMYRVRRFEERTLYAYSQQKIRKK